MRNVLLFIHDDAGQEARLQAALDLTRALGGHLTCLDVSLLPVVTDNYFPTGATATLLSDECAREKANRTRIEARLSHEDVPWNCIEMIGNAADCIRENAGLADVIVLNREFEKVQDPAVTRLADEMVVRSGRPIVAVSETTRRFDVAGPVLVAWDGSPASSAALRAAIPLLKLAERVIILEVEDGSIEHPAEEAAEYCSRHGIKPLIQRETASRDIPSTVILDQIAAHRATYLVMGGFGHRRWVEAAFGGVTRRMLKECPVPLFLAH